MSSPVTITAVGDLALYGKVPEAVSRVGADVFCAEARAVLAEGVLRFANLEVPLVEDARIGEVYLCGSIEMADVPRALGLNVLSAANNHIMDAGPEGLLTTLRAVHERGIATAGAGATLSDARRPAVVDAGGARIGVLAYAEGNRRLHHHVARPHAAGVAPIDEQLMVEDVRAVRGRVDLLVVSMHWGVNYMRFAMPGQRRLARVLAGEGVDVVLGTHPHVQQGLERVGATLVAYSLGDFIGDTTVGNVVRPERAAARRNGAVLTIRAERGGPHEASWTPFFADESFRPRRLDGAAAAERVKALAELDSYYEEGRYPADPWADAGKEIGGHALSVIWFHLRRGNVGYLARRLFRIRARHLRMLKGLVAGR